jgi:cell division protease FtsH
MQQVDAEIRRIIDEQYTLARKLIEANSDKVEAMASALMEWETIDADQITDIMEGRPPRPPKAPANTQSPPPSQGNATAPAATATPAREA